MEGTESKWKRDEIGSRKRGNGKGEGKTVEDERNLDDERERIKNEMG